MRDVGRRGCRERMPGGAGLFSDSIVYVPLSVDH